jgi:hypothetical protein
MGTVKIGLSKADYLRELNWARAQRVICGTIAPSTHATLEKSSHDHFSFLSDVDCQFNMNNFFCRTCPSL